MKATNYACLKVEEKITKVLKKIKTILFTLEEINLPLVLD